MKKADTHVFLGMQRDMAISKQKSEFLWDAHNIRVTARGEDTLLSMTNERSTRTVPKGIVKKVEGKVITVQANPEDPEGDDIINVVDGFEYTMAEPPTKLLGKYLGHATLNSYLVVFTHTEPNVDRIYRVERLFSKTYGYIADVALLYEGDLGFDMQYPIETLSSFESELVQKVYWIDGKNQPRTINIVKDKLLGVSLKNPKEIYLGETPFDFIPKIGLEHTITIKKEYGSGMFPAGMLQYVCTYYNKYGQESNIFYTSPMLTISHPDRGGSPEDKCANSFILSFRDLDKNFDFVRIYSIIRTSIDAVPTVKRVGDMAIEREVTNNYSVDGFRVSGTITYKDMQNNTVSQEFETASPLYVAKDVYDAYDVKVTFNNINVQLSGGQQTFVDDGTLGDAVDSTILLFMQNSPYVANTMQDKDGTLFFGGLQKKEEKETELCFAEGEFEEGLSFFRGDTLNFDRPSYHNVYSDIYLSRDVAAQILKDFKITISIGGTFYEKSLGDELTIDNAEIYTNTLTTGAGLYKGNYYRFGIQYQRNDGSWTNPVFVADRCNNMDLTNYGSKRIMQAAIGNGVKGYKMVRPLICYASELHKTGVFTGISCPTVMPKEALNEKEAKRKFQVINNFHRYESGELEYETIFNHANDTVDLYYKENSNWVSIGAMETDSAGIFYCDMIKKEYRVVWEVLHIMGSPPTNVRFSFDFEWDSESSFVQVNGICNFHMEGAQAINENLWYTHRFLPEGNLIFKNSYIPHVQASWFSRFKLSDRKETQFGGLPEYRNMEMIVSGKQKDSEFPFFESPFMVNEYIRTLHSPDLEFADLTFSLRNSSIERLNYAGVANCLYTDSKMAVQTSTPSKKGPGFENTSLYRFLNGYDLQGNPVDTKHADIIIWDGYKRVLQKTKGWLGVTTSEEVHTADFKINSSFDVSDLTLQKIEANLVATNGEGETMPTRIVGNEIHISDPKKAEYYFKLRYAGNGEFYYYWGHWFEKMDSKRKMVKLVLKNVPYVSGATAETTYSEYSLIASECYTEGTTKYWMYPWQPSGSISEQNLDDTNSDYVTINEVFNKLKFNRSLNYKFAKYDTINNAPLEYDSLEVFDSDQVIPVELYDKGNKLWYYGTIDTLLMGERTKIHNNEVQKDDTGISVRLKYKSTKHAVSVLDRFTSNFSNKILDLKRGLPMISMTRDYGDVKEVIFGGTSEEAFTNNLWYVAGNPVKLEVGSTIVWEWGDSWRHRYDCLKTYPFTLEDENSVVEVLSCDMDTYVNLDGRYDRNINTRDNLLLTPTIFNKWNPVYNQKNNYFSYRIMPNDFYKIHRYDNVVTWTLQKNLMEDVDAWTHITMANTLDMPGNLGTVHSINTLQDALVCFQDKGISRINFNARVQIPVSDGVPVEISNNYKVDGFNVISDMVGCSNKWSIAKSRHGLYFIDANTKALYVFDGSLKDISTQKGFYNWFKELDYGKWLPEADMGMCCQYDNYNGDLYILTGRESLVFSETLGEFTSFMSYKTGKDSIQALFNIQDAFYALHSDTEDGLPALQLWEMFAGLDWNYQFGKYCPYGFTLVSNAEFALDKIFSSIETRVDFWNPTFKRALVGEDAKYVGLTLRPGGDGTNPDDLLPTYRMDSFIYDYVVDSLNLMHFKFFGSLQAYNEYQDSGEVSMIPTNDYNGRLDIPKGHITFGHESHLAAPQTFLLPKKKFRIWRVDIPRDGSGNRRNALARMRNTWLKIKISSYVDGTPMLQNPVHEWDRTNNEMMQLHDISVIYHTL